MIADRRIGTGCGNGFAVTIKVDSIICFENHLLVRIGILVVNIIAQNDLAHNAHGQTPVRPVLLSDFPVP